MRRNTAVKTTWVRQKQKDFLLKFFVSVNDVGVGDKTFAWTDGKHFPIKY